MTVCGGAEALTDIGVRLEGKSALVIGASSGIGLAVADAYLKFGADVTVLAIDDAIHEAAGELSRKHSRKVPSIQCDATDRSAIQVAVDQTDKIDILVYNAGFERITPLTDPDPVIEEHFQKIIDVNLIGALYATRAALSKIPDGGRIIYTASTYSKYAIAQMSGYSASKHGLLGMMRSFSMDLGPRRITVNAVCPGWVDTEFSHRSVRQIAMNTNRTVEDVGNDVLTLQAMPGILQPTDIVGGYLFFASELAKDVTGQTLHIDRGECQG